MKSSDMQASVESFQSKNYHSSPLCALCFLNITASDGSH